MLKPRQKKQIVELADSRPIELIYLFGSQANGQLTPLSDFDFAILSEESLSSPQRSQLKLEMIALLTRLLSTDKVDILDLNSSPPTLRFAAISPRQNIFARSEAMRTDFEHKTMQDYLDRVYYINRHTAHSLATIAREGLKINHGN